MLLYELVALYTRRTEQELNVLFVHYTRLHQRILFFFVAYLPDIVSYDVIVL